jgi:hypothetical protein
MLIAAFFTQPSLVLTISVSNSQAGCAILAALVVCTVFDYQINLLSKSLTFNSKNITHGFWKRVRKIRRKA